MRIRAGQKHEDPADPDPKPWFKGNIENSTKHGHGENMSGINIR